MASKSFFDGPIPRLDAIRRVQTRYQRMLPLELMKRQQCIVVGAARGVLTVAVTDQHYEPLIASLKKLTGHPIFPVIIEPARMRMLIKRIERFQRRKDEQVVGRPYYLHRIQAQTFIHFLLNRDGYASSGAP